MVAFPSSQSVPRLWSPPLFSTSRGRAALFSLSLFSLVSLEPPPSMVLPIRPLEKWARGCRTKVGTFFRYSIGGRDSPSSRFPPRCEGTYVVFIVSRPSALTYFLPPVKLPTYSRRTLFLPCLSLSFVSHALRNLHPHPTLLLHRSPQIIRAQKRETSFPFLPPPLSRKTPPLLLNWK